jgi:hypothetical protein
MEHTGTIEVQVLNLPSVRDQVRQLPQYANLDDEKLDQLVYRILIGDHDAKHIRQFIKLRTGRL